VLVGGEGGCDDEASEFGAQCRSGCVLVDYDAHIPVTGSAEWSGTSFHALYRRW
jgi:hypothetical protein